MFSMGTVFVIFTMLLLCGGVALTLLWFRQSAGRPSEARVKPEAGKKDLGRL